MDSKKNHSIFKKLKNFLDNDLKKIKKPQVLEFGVRNGISTYYFLKEINILQIPIKFQKISPLIMIKIF